MTNRKNSIFHFACRFVEHENSTDSLIITIQFHNSNVNKQDMIQKDEKHAMIPNILFQSHNLDNDIIPMRCTSCNLI